MTVSHIPTRRRDESSDIQPLEQGDRLDRKTFHERYAAMLPGTRAELIGGIVHMSPPLRADHGTIHSALIGWLRAYRAATPGLRVLDNATDKLADDSEPQPDAMLLIEGGQTREDNEGYIVGPPELVAEVASTSQSRDLHIKKQDYERHGVKEYLVVVVRDRRAVWFVRANDKFVEIEAAPDGTLRSTHFPGLWLDVDALFRDDDQRLHAVVAQGVSTSEHAAFVTKRSKA